jgi:hypothetical protein
MSKKRIVVSLFALLFVIAAVSGAYAVFNWTWPQYDKPTYGTPAAWEYQSSFGNSQSIPVPLLSKYVAPNLAENEMRNILPAFSPKKLISADNTPGSLLYTPRHDEYQAFIRDLANSTEGRERMRIKPLGEYPKGFPITLAVFSKPAVLEPEELKALGKPIVWAHAAIHANEQDAVAGLSYVMYKLAAGHWDNYLDKVSVLVLLRLNADGAYYNIRGNPTLPTKIAGWSSGRPSTAIDMNRDNMWLESPVLRAMHYVWSSYQPHFSTGHHQMGTSSGIGGNSAYLASKDASGNVVYHSSGRVQLLVSRDISGNPILSSQPSASSSGGLINLAVTYPRTTAVPAASRDTAISASETLYYNWDIGYATGDHGNIPIAQRDYFYEKVVPAVTDLMESRGVRLGLYLDAPTAPGLAETPWGEKVYIPYAGEIRPNTSTTAGTETITVYDGTGAPAGATNGLWLDTGNMHSTTSLKGAIGILYESRAPSHQPWTYPRRVFAQATAVEGLLKYAAENATELKNLIDNTRNQMGNLSEVYTLMKYDSKSHVVKDVPYYTASGDEVKRDVPIYHPKTTFARDGHNPRKRPHAYILPKTDVNKIAVARMGFHGVKYHVLSEDTMVNVEVFDSLKRGPLIYAQNNQMRGRDPGYSATGQSADLVPWIPGFLVHATEPVAKTVMVPKGSFVIYAAQPFIGAYLAAVMEPDCERSFARLTMARRLERDPTTFANNRDNWVVPYRYMTPQSLPTNEVIQFYPLVEKAFIMDTRPRTGSDLPKEFAMMQDIDVISDTDGFLMQFPAYDEKNLTLCAYDWDKKEYTKLIRAVSTYGVPNVYAVSPEFHGPAFEGYSFEIEPLAKAMNTKMVRVALMKKTEPDKPDEPCEIGCNSMALSLFALLLIPVLMRRRR